MTQSQPRLFQPLSLNALTVPNRVVVAPMCQYSAVDGMAGDWHQTHIGMLASNGAGLFIIEATAVSAEGRITPGCLGIWNDSQADALKRVIDATRSFRTARIGIQLSHAGRKGSTRAPFDGGTRLALADGGWLTPAPSAVAFKTDDPEPPVALSRAQLDAVRDDFVQAALRALRAGVELIELHMAHGYLLHQFLSPLANQRTDEYGGSLENRLRFPREVFQAVKAAIPATVPLGVRISATDWVDGGWNADETASLCQQLEALGCDFFHMSTGGLSPAQKIAAGPGYQVPFAARVKRETSVPVIAVGMITDPAQAEAVIAEDQADMVALGRQMLFEPHWAWRAAVALGGQVAVPPQYLRALPASPSIALR